MTDQILTAAPEAPPQEPEAETGTPTPVSVDDALAALHKAVGHHASDSMSRALADFATALLAERAEQTGPPQGIPEAWAGAVHFMMDLQRLLDRLDQDQARNANAVLEHLFARHAPQQPNGAFR